MPGVIAGPAPKVSVWMRLAVTPQAARLPAKSVMKADGPHRIEIGIARHAQFLDAAPKRPGASKSTASRSPGPGAL